jgi:hypothetical protein
MNPKTLPGIALAPLFGAVLLAGGCAAGAASDRPSAQAAVRGPEAALLARMRAACGGDAWDRVRGWHEAGRVDMPGRPGLRYEAFHEITTLRTTYVQRLDGRIVRLGGFDGAQSWRVLPDGSVETSADPAALRRTRRDMYLSNAGYFFPDRFPAAFALAGTRSWNGRTFDVLRVTPADAESADLWIDRETRRIGRIVAGAEAAEGSDYRTFAGVCTPTSLRQGDGDPAHDIVLRVETVDTGPIDPARFVPSPAAVPR